MSEPLTKRCTDHSDKESFSFSFFCDQCGKEWKSLPAAFVSGGFTAIEHEETRQLIWEQEHRIAFEKANLEAHMFFNLENGERVCDGCFEKENNRN